jgi:hypothetical protein
MPTNENFFSKLLEREHEHTEEIADLKIPEAPSVYTELAPGEFHPFAQIKFKGVFDLQRLYRVMVRWLKSRKFEFHETLYRFKPPELIINWTANRRKTAFVMDIIRVNIDVRGYEDVETIVNGVKKKMTKGRLTINLTFGLDSGYADITGARRWNSSLERKLKRFLHRFVIKRDFELLHLDALMYETWKFHKVIKDYLHLECHGNLY